MPVQLCSPCGLSDETAGAAFVPEVLVLNPPEAELNVPVAQGASARHPVERPHREAADVLRRYGSEHRLQHQETLSHVQRRVMNAIERCRTEALGHRERCDACGCQFPPASCDPLMPRWAENSCRRLGLECAFEKPTGVERGTPGALSIVPTSVCPANPGPKRGGGTAPTIAGSSGLRMACAENCWGNIVALLDGRTVQS